MHTSVRVLIRARDPGAGSTTGRLRTLSGTVCGKGEGRLASLRRLVEADYLPHVLQRCSVYLLFGRRWFEVEKRLDGPTHSTRPPDQMTNRMTRPLLVCLLCNRRWIRPSSS